MIMTLIEAMMCKVWMS